MKESEAKKIFETAEEEGLTNVRVHEGYSGRGMFGERTWAVSGDEGEVADAIALSGFRPSTFRRDSLGRGIVVY